MYEFDEPGDERQGYLVPTSWFLGGMFALSLAVSWLGFIHVPGRPIDATAILGMFGIALAITLLPAALLTGWRWLQLRESVPTEAPALLSTLLLLILCTGLAQGSIHTSRTEGTTGVPFVSGLPSAGETGTNKTASAETAPPASGDGFLDRLKDGFNEGYMAEFVQQCVDTTRQGLGSAINRLPEGTVDEICQCSAEKSLETFSMTEMIQFARPDSMSPELQERMMQITLECTQKALAGKV